MIEKSNKKLKESFVTEEDISSLLQRYSAPTVLALLREVAQFTGVKIDWNLLVQRTSTGISNAREYQMLWRHLAYRHALIDKFEDGARPLDDESDLECELEALPAPTSDDLKEAESCTKIMMAAGLPNEPGQPNSTAEAPSLTKIPNGKSIGASSENPHMSQMRRMNITIPKQPQTAFASGEGIDKIASASGTSSSKRKRKNWLEEEDKLLMKSVEKYGEGNWATLAKTVFKGERTAQQLSQRWPIVRKRYGSMNAGTNSGSFQLTKEQEAARRAVDYALPMKSTITKAVGNLLGSYYTLTGHVLKKYGMTRPNVSLDCLVRKSYNNLMFELETGGKTSNNALRNTVTPSTKTEALPGQNQSHLFSNRLLPSSMGPSELKAKSQFNMKTMTGNLSADPVTAAAVAAGARIVSQADATALLKPQANNTVHIMRTGVATMKPNIPAGAPALTEAQPSICHASTGPGAAPISSGLTDSSHLALLRTSSLNAQHNKTASTASVDKKIEPNTAELAAKQIARTAVGNGVSQTKEVAKEQILEGSRVSENEAREQVDKLSLQNPEMPPRNQTADGGSSVDPVMLQAPQSGKEDVTGNQIEGSQKARDNKTTVLVTGEGKTSAVHEGGRQATVDKEEVDPNTLTNGRNEKLESESVPKP